MKKKTKLDILKELDSYKTFGQQVKNAMEEKGYSRQRLSEELSSKKLYVSEKDVDNWQKDKAYPDITTIYLISEMLDLNPNDLLIAKQLMQEAGIASINMQLIRVICRILDKSILFSYWLIKTIFWIVILEVLVSAWSGAMDYTEVVINPVMKVVVSIIIAILAGIGNYISLL